MASLINWHPLNSFQQVQVEIAVPVAADFKFPEVGWLLVSQFSRNFHGNYDWLARLVGSVIEKCHEHFDSQ